MVLAKSLSLSDPIQPSFNVSEASRPKRSLRKDQRQKREAGSVSRPRTVEYKEALQTNWMSPLLWVHIKQAANNSLPQMSPTEICRELRKVDPVLFAGLHTQTLRRWIDSSGEQAVWSKRTLERVATGYSPGGMTTRIGVLVRTYLAS